MAFVLERDSDARQELVRNVRDVYRLRSQYIDHRVSVSEEAELEAFWYDARRMFLAAISNVGRFDTRMKFVEAIERLKFGGARSEAAGEA